MSRTFTWRAGMAGLLSAAVVALFSPAALARGPSGGGHVGGSMGMHSSFGAVHSGNFSGVHAGNFSAMHVTPHFNSGFATRPTWSTGRTFVNPHVASRVVVPGNTVRFNTWNRAGVAFHNNNWWAARSGARPGWAGYNRWWHYGRWWPWYSFAGWPGYYDYGYTYPYYYGYYGYPYTGDYYGGTYDVTPYASDYATAEPATEEAIPPEPLAEPEVAPESSDFYTQAVAAFQQGDYGNALRLAGHAAVDDPRNPNVHLLMMLGMFAMGQYRGAAMESHAVTALGGSPDWPTVYRLYGNVATYTDQLRALEKFIREHPKAADGRFLLGFQYMIAGHTDAAKDEFLLALTVTPQDHIAADLLSKEGGTIPPEIAAQLAKPPIAPAETIPGPETNTARKLPIPPPAPQR